MHASLSWITEALAEWEARGLRRHLQSRSTPQGAGIEFADAQLVNFTSNDYLGLAGNPLVTAVIDAVREHGWGAGASPLVTGRAECHAALETALADFEHAEAALLFTSGYAANIGVITALAGKRDAIFSDAKNHASIIDGCRLSGGQVFVYPHADVPALDRMLAENAGPRRKLIVTDGLFSMDGDLAPLKELAECAERRQAMLVVDEAHATGVFGAAGRGSCEHFGVEEQVAVRIGTLSKALGSIGGFVAGPQPLIDWLSNRARTYVYSTAMPEAAAAAGIRALELVRQEPHRRETLLQRAARVRIALAQQGWDVTPSASQVIPVRVGDPLSATRLADQLRDRGMLVPAIRPPSVPEGESLLRVSLSYSHTDAMIDQLLAAFSKLRAG